MNSMTDGFLNDDDARVAIRTELDTNMLVEAGAGSGKTTLMVDRLLAYVARGTPVDTLAAITFTRKAANELRQRFEAKMEESARTHGGDVQQRFLVALQHRERMFIGTVHAFCGRILREHALDAGLPPDFTELDQFESNRLRNDAWRQFIEQAARDENPLLIAVQRVGVDPLSLFDAFELLERYRDVEFPAAEHSCPDHATVRDRLLAFVSLAATMRPAEHSERDELQKTLDRLRRTHRAHNNWMSAPEFVQDITVLLSKSARKLTQKYWGDNKPEKEAAKEFSAAIDAFVEGPLTAWLEEWWAHVYAPVVALLRAGSNWALRQRRRSGQLGFDDLLTETARLLRSHPDTRRVVGERFRHLLVDEFQDTDPVQAEVCFLITSDPTEGADWRNVMLREGALFVVGDPKQSIYRFRRADLAMYGLVESRIRTCGKVLHLTRNFRSVAAIGTVVNEHFASEFVQPGDSTEFTQRQAPFATFVAATRRVPHANAGISRYVVGAGGRTTNEELVREDAAVLASWISRRCSAGGDRKPQDFLILTPRKDELAQYAHELALRNIPVSVTGASNSADEVLYELLIVLRALADPANPVAVIAALEGWCVGCSHEDLWNARESGLEFRMTHAPSEDTTPAGAGLMQLYHWWMASQRIPAASLLERVMDDSGLLLMAASSDLGDRSAGQLLRLVSVLQSSSGTDLASAIDAIEQSLNDEDEAPALRVASGNAVRLMNLHKAKGLEAPVVVLAAPKPQEPKPPKIATWRLPDGTANGALQLQDDNGQPVGQPINWDALAEDEMLRIEAERARLLYVAVTRAEEELVVSQRASYTVNKTELRTDTSHWAPLAPVLLRHARELQLAEDVPPGRRVVQVTAKQLRAEIRDASMRLEGAQVSRYALVSITEAAKRDSARAAEDGASLTQELMDSESPDPESESGVTTRGAHNKRVDIREFGTLAHAAMEAALRGRTGEALARYVRAQVWQMFPAASQSERDAIAQRAIDAVAEAERSESWKTLQERGGLAELNVAGITRNPETGFSTLSEGIIDAVARDGDSWVVVDWKFSGASDAGWKSQLPAYQAQTGAYAETLRQRTGISGVARIERIRAKR